MRQRGRHWSYTLNIYCNIMALSDKVPITGWEKWINRIVTIALALYTAIQQIIANWPAK